MRTRHGYRPGRSAAGDRDVRAAASGVLRAVVDHGAITGDHELDHLVSGLLVRHLLALRGQGDQLCNQFGQRGTDTGENAQD
jgi:hypothetical protein